MAGRHKQPLFLLSFLALLLHPVFSATAEGVGSNEDDWIASMMEILELEYEDQCSQVAEANWALLNERTNAFEEKLDADKAFGNFAKSQVSEVKDLKADKDTPLRRKLDLISKPGDVLLDIDQWNNLITYSDVAIRNMEITNNIDCRTDVPQSCTYSEFLSTLADSRDRHLLTSAKASWETKLPDEKKFASSILPLARNASKLNGFDNVDEYWEMLSEYPGGYSKAQELWSELEPLYLKLHQFLAMKLQKNNGSLKDDGSIPTQWLGSVFGEDWSSLVDLILPDNHLFQEINNNLKQKLIGGRFAFKSAGLLLQRLGLKDLKTTFWRDSKFDKTCPAKLISFCRGSIIYVFTCNNVSLPLLLDAHEKVMSAKHAETKMQSRSNTYIIREANRYSALDVAISELGSLLALTPHQLNAEDVLPLKNFQPAMTQTKVAFLMLTALRDLPRLSYYLAVDKWRLKLLQSGGPINIGSSWASTRRNMSKVSPSDKDFLGDTNVISNKPYLHKFFGILLKYQMLDKLSEDMLEPNGDLVKHIAEGTPIIKELMSKAYSHEWPQLVKDTLDIRDISSEALLEYFQPLADYLSDELDDSETKSNDDEINYEDEDEVEENHENEEEDEEKDNIIDNVENEKSIETIPEPEVVTEKEIKIKPSILKTESENKQSSEPTEVYDDNPHLIPKGQGSPAASSSGGEGVEPAPQQSKLPYAWIALGIFIVIIAILAIVIGRKRYKHKKELERERREGAA